MTGTLSIDTGTGDLLVRDADVSELVATSGSGSVNLAMLSVPDRITVDTGAGDLWVAVPFGTYRIDARTGAGQVSISGLTADEEATSVLDLETGRGDIVVEGID